MLSSHPHQNSLQFRCDIQINFLEPGMYCYKPLLFLFAFRFEPKYKHIQHIHGFVIDVECKYIKSMPVTWMELNHTTQPQTHFISINMRHLGTKIRDTTLLSNFFHMHTVKTFGYFSCDLRQNSSLKAFRRHVPGSQEHFSTAADRNELKVV